LTLLNINSAQWAPQDRVPLCFAQCCTVHCYSTECVTQHDSKKSV